MLQAIQPALGTAMIGNRGEKRRQQHHGILSSEKFLSTGQNFQSPQEILKFPAEVEGDVTQEVETMAEEGLERAPQCFFSRKVNLT